MSDQVKEVVTELAREYEGRRRFEEMTAEALPKEAILRIQNHRSKAEAFQEAFDLLKERFPGAFK